MKSVLAAKNKAAAWFVTNYKDDCFHNDYLTRLQEHLHHYSLKIDAYGGYTGKKCGIAKECEEMIKKDYYFYMAFENSLSEDYVTDKLMHGYDNYAVPIVYGAANYSRFLPPGSYINAREIHPYNLAYMIKKAIEDPTVYEKYFKWTNKYTISTNLKEQHPLCLLCIAMNSEKAKYSPARKAFRIWWNRLNGMKWCLSDEFWKF